MNSMMNRSNATTASNQAIAMHVYDAPRETVFKAWTEQDRLASWFGPKGFTMVSAKLDLRPGGTFRYCLRSPEGREMWAKFVYREIAAPKRLVFVLSFSDKDGNTVRSASTPDWPLELLMTVTFEEHQGKTVVTIHGNPINATDVEQKVYAAGYEPMQSRWARTLNELADYLARA